MGSVFVTQVDQVLELSFVSAQNRKREVRALFDEFRTATSRYQKRNSCVARKVDDKAHSEVMKQNLQGGHYAKELIWVQWCKLALLCALIDANFPKRGGTGASSVEHEKHCRGEQQGSRAW